MITAPTHTLSLFCVRSLSPSHLLPVEESQGSVYDWLKLLTCTILHVIVQLVQIVQIVQIETNSTNSNNYCTNSNNYCYQWCISYLLLCNKLHPKTQQLKRTCIYYHQVSVGQGSKQGLTRSSSPGSPTGCSQGVGQGSSNLEVQGAGSTPRITQWCRQDSVPFWAVGLRALFLHWPSGRGHTLFFVTSPSSKGSS